MAESTSRGRGGRWKRVLGVGGIVFVLVVAAVLAFGPVVIGTVARSSIERAASEAISGEVSVEAVRVSWFGGQRVEGVTLREPSGGTVARVASVSVERGALALLREPADLGDVVLSGVELMVAVGRRGQSNVTRALAAADEAEEGVAERMREAPMIPSGLNIRPVAAEPIEVRWSTPNDAGRLEMRLEAEAITATRPATVTLTTTQARGDGGGGSDGTPGGSASGGDAHAVTASFSFARLAGADGRLDVGRAEPRLVVSGENVPPALAEIGAALLPGARTELVRPGGASREPIAFSLGVELKDGRLRLVDRTQPAYLDIPITAGLLSTFLADVEASGGGGVSIETPGTPARLTIERLDVPLDGAVGRALGWGEASGAGDGESLSLGDTEVIATLETPAGRVRMTPGAGGRVRVFDASAGVLRLEASPLGEGVTFTGSISVTPERGEAAEVEIDLSAAALVTASGSLAPLERASVSGTVSARNIATGALAPFTVGVDLVPLVGDALDLSIDASAPSVGEPVELLVRAETTDALSMSLAASLAEGVLTERDDREAGVVGLRVRDGRASRRVGVGVEALTSAVRVAAGSGDGAGVATIDVPRFRVPLGASQPLTEATAEIVARLTPVVLERAQSAAGGGPGQARTTVTFDASATVESGVVRVTPSDGSGGEGVIATADDVASVLDVLGVSRRVMVGGDAAGPGGAGGAISVSVEPRGGASLRLASGGEGGVVMDLSRDDWLMSLRGAVEVALGEVAVVRMAKAGGEGDREARLERLVVRLDLERADGMAAVRVISGERDGGRVGAGGAGSADVGEAGRVVADVTAAWPRDVVLGAVELKAPRLTPVMDGVVTGLPVSFASALLGEAGAAVEAAVGEAARVDLSRVAVGGEDGTLVEVLMAAGDSASATVLATGRALRFANMTARVPLDPGRVDRVLAATEEGGAGGGGREDGGVSTAGVRLGNAVTVKVRADDVELPFDEVGEPRFDAVEPVSVVATASGPIDVALRDASAVGGRRTLRLAEASLNATAPLGGGGATSLNASAAVFDPDDLSAALANASLEATVGDGPPVGMVAVREGRPGAIDRWLGEAADRPLAVTLGERFNLEVATSLGATGGGEGGAAADGGFVLRLDAERLEVNGRLLPERADGAVVGYRLAAPIAAEVRVAPALVGLLTDVAGAGGDGTGGGGEASLRLASTTPVGVEVRALRLGSLGDVFAAERFAIDAAIEARGVRLLTPRARAGGVSGRRRGLGGAGGPGGLDEASDAPAPIDIARLTMNVERGAGETGSAGLADAPLRFSLTARDGAGAETFTVRGEVSDSAGAEGGVSRGVNAGGGDAAPVRMDARVRGSVPTRLVDALAGADGLLVVALGETATLEVNLTGFAPDRTAGRLVGPIESPRASASVNAAFADGAVILDPDSAGAPTNVTVSEISNEFSRRVLGVLFPMLDSFEKTAADEPLMLTAARSAPVAARAGDRGAVRGGGGEGGRSLGPLTIPTDGDASKLNGTLRVDLGTVSFSSSRLLRRVLDATSNNVEGTLAGNIEPITVTFRDGVASYDELVIPFGDVTLESSASIDLVKQTMEVVVLVPLSEVSGDIKRAAERVPGVGRVAVIPLRAAGPIGEASFELAPELLRESLGETLRNEAERAVDEALRDALKDIFDRE